MPGKVVICKKRFIADIRDMEKGNNFSKVKHLYSRMAFGLHYDELHTLAANPLKKTVKHLLRSADADDPLDVAGELLQNPRRMGNVTEPEIKEFNQLRNKQERSVNVGWMVRLSTTQRPFLEKMTLFWHTHFACRSNNGYYLQQLNNIHRKYALGNFRTLLIETARSPAMLSFLNNQQNRKGHPNENFARELMELFTLGRGNYTENDIRESARAFTGWQYRLHTGFFMFNAKQHDDTQKLFFGKRGKFGGEDIIDFILENPATSAYIAGKVYSFFVNDIPDSDKIARLAGVFRDANYEIKPLMEELMTSEWFYHPSNIGNKIKSPVELLVGLNRMFGVTYAKPEILLQLQRSLGQALFYPPNVAGWPGGRNWIDSSSLMTRLKLPSIILNGGLIESDGKTDPEDEAYLASARKQRSLIEKRTQSAVNWDLFSKGIPAGISREDLAETLISGRLNSNFFPQIDPNDIKQIALQLVSTPEYQLC